MSLFRVNKQLIAPLQIMQMNNNILHLFSQADSLTFSEKDDSLLILIGKQWVCTNKCVADNYDIN